MAVPAATARLVDMFSKRSLPGLGEREAALTGAARTVVSKVRSHACACGEAVSTFMERLCLRLCGDTVTRALAPALRVLSLPL